MSKLKPIQTGNINKVQSDDAFAAFRKDTALLSLIADVNPASIMLLKAARNNEGMITDLEFLFTNRQALESIGRGDMRGKCFSEEFPYTKENGLLDAYIKVIETGNAYSDNTYTLVDGKDCWAKVHAIKVGDGCLVSYLDITEQTKAANELLHIKDELAQSATDKYYKLFNSIEQGFCILEVIYEQEQPVDFRYIAINPAFEKQSGLTNVIGKTLLEVVPGIETVWLNTCSTVAVTGESIRLENYVRQLGKWFDVYAFCIDKPADRHIAVLFSDVTQRKQTEEALVESAKVLRQTQWRLESALQERTEEIKKLNQQLTFINRELESRNTEIKTFNSIAANDYNETLRHLYTSLEYIVSNDARHLSDAGRANIRRAQASIQKMKLLTQDMVSYTRLHEVTKEKENVDLDIIIENVLSDFEKKMDVSAITVDCDDLPVVTGYPFLLSLVFHHLIDNAIKFQKEGVRLVIKISCKESVSGNGVSHEAAQPQQHYHIISVKDNGIGISAQHLHNIFEVFYRVSDKNKHRGSGIGLAVCKKVMQMHDGFITVESEPGAGSTFHCYFPISKF